MIGIKFKLKGNVPDLEIPFQVLFDFTLDLINLAEFKVLIQLNMSFQMNLLVRKHPGMDMVDIQHIRQMLNPSFNGGQIQMIWG